jgi:catechol-2,3-dioxygenase
MTPYLDWLTLEVKYLDRAIEFYTENLDLEFTKQSDYLAHATVGESTLKLQSPYTVPRGGLHTHFAFSTTSTEYPHWWDSLSTTHDLIEHSFSSGNSLYFYDPDGNCLEIGEQANTGTGLTGIFEIVLEVEDLQTAETYYTSMGGEPISRSTDRPRVRLDFGSFDIELWEPHLGIADARGGVHVDFGIALSNPAKTASNLASSSQSVTQLSHGVRLRDPDGHYITLTQHTE